MSHLTAIDTNAPRQSVVDELRTALAMAEAGEMTDVVIVGNLRGHEMYRAASFSDVIALAGCLHMAMNALTRAVEGD